MLVCTRNRPETLSNCLESISKIVCPPGVQLTVVVGDNNDRPQKHAISSQAEKLGLNFAYVYEPRRGYCYIRNALLKAAELLRHEILIFIDDDELPDPGLVSAYLDCFSLYDADVVHGSYAGSTRRYPEGQKARKVATYNVAFRRRLIAPASEGGLALRFDTRLNLTGREDLEFFRDAACLGARMIYSERPLTYRKRLPSAPYAETYALARNDVYVERVRRGSPAALYLFLKTYLRRGLLAAFLATTAILGKKTQGENDHSASPLDANVALFCGGLDGLLFGGVDRPAAKNGDIIPIAVGAGTETTSHGEEGIGAVSL